MTHDRRVPAMQRAVAGRRIQLVRQHPRMRDHALRQRQPLTQPVLEAFPKAVSTCCAVGLVVIAIWPLAATTRCPCRTYAGYVR